MDCPLYTAQVNNTIQAFPFSFKNKGLYRSIPVISNTAEYLSLSKGNCVDGVVKAFAVNLSPTTQQVTEALIFCLEEMIQYFILKFSTTICTPPWQHFV